MDVRQAIASRRSTRAFRDQPVEQAVLERILVEAARAPSGGNLQPWNLVVLTGEAKEALVQRVQERVRTAEGVPPPQFPIYPSKLWSPYRERRFRSGQRLHESLGIEQSNQPARLRQVARNWQFFDAPVGALLFVDRRFGSAQWLDLGGFLQTLMLLLHDAGLASCAQEAWSVHHDIVSSQVPVDDQSILVCGISIGYADPAAPQNSFVTERAELHDFVRFFN